MTLLYRRPLTSAIVSTLLLVGIADVLFFGNDFGANLALYGLLQLAVLGVVDRRTMASGRGKCLAFALVLLSGSMLWEPSRLAFLLGLLGLVSLALFPRLGWPEDPLRWPGVWKRFPLACVSQAVDDLREFLFGGAVRRAAGSIRGPWLLCLAMGGAFVVLFIVANPILERWAAALTNGFWYQIDLGVPRMLLWVTAGVFAWGLLRVLPRLESRADCRPREGLALRPVQVSLLAFNGIFLMQNGLDAIYLWGNRVLPSTMTWAQYAHRGVYPLSLSVGLAAVFILMAFPRGSEGERSRTARRLLCAWLIQNVVLCLSAGWRLHLYVQEYGLTQWRVATFLWMGLVVPALGLVLFRIVGKRTNLWLVQRQCALWVGALYLCAFVNFGGMIAWYNVQHCREIQGAGANVDLFYLRYHLGVEAAPALKWYANRMAGTESGTQAAKEYEELRADAVRARANWGSWTLARELIGK